MTTTKEIASLLYDAVQARESDIDFDGPYVDDISVHNETSLLLDYEDGSKFIVSVQEN